MSQDKEHSTHHKSKLGRSIITAFMAATMFGGMIGGSSGHEGATQHMPHTNRTEEMERRRKEIFDAQKSKTAKRDVGLGGALEETEEVYRDEAYTMLRSHQVPAANDQTHASLDIHPRYTVVASTAKVQQPAI